MCERIGNGKLGKEEEDMRWGCEWEEWIMMRGECELGR